MIKAYIYCSYKLSPVGFKLGVIDITNNQTDDFIPEYKNIDNFIKNAFYQGMIKCVFGKIPQNNRYTVLIKKLRFQGDKFRQADKYMNIAFEFDDFEEYKIFAGNIYNLYGSQYEGLIQRIASFIIPDGTVESYALKIDAKGINDFKDDMLRSDDIRCDIKKYIDDSENKTYIETIYEINGTEDIIQMFEIDLNTYHVRKVKQELYYICEGKLDFKSKKKFLPNLIIISGIVLSILTVWLILCLNK